MPPSSATADLQVGGLLWGGKELQARVCREAAGWGAGEDALTGFLWAGRRRCGLAISILCWENQRRIKWYVGLNAGRDAGRVAVFETMEGSGRCKLCVATLGGVENVGRR